MKRASRRTTSDAELEELEIDLLLTGIAQRYGYDFRNYTKASLKRRIRRAAQDEGVPTVSALQERILHDTDALQRFVSTVSVRATALFRDPSFYRALRREVIPKLRTYPFIRAWVAGCATGEEVYSLAILLTEEGLYERARLYATDISEELLEQAARSVFPLDRMKDYTHNYQQAGGRRDFSSYYRVQSGRVVFDPALRRNVVFSQHNLAVDSVFNEFQLILCRNVMIYFNRALRKHVHDLLHQSLCRFGFLALGSRETLRFTTVEDHYETVDPDSRIYRKLR